MKTDVEYEMARPLPRVDHHHWLHCGVPTQVDLTLWVGPKHEGVSDSVWLSRLLRTGIEKQRIKLLPRLGHHHWLRCGPLTQVDVTLWVGPEMKESVWLSRLQHDKLLPEAGPVLCCRRLPRPKVARLVVVTYLSVYPIPVLLE